MIDYSDFIYLYKKGCEYNAHLNLGAHFTKKGAKNGFRFAVFAPKAENVYLTGEFNQWSQTHKMDCDQGIWYTFVEGAKHGQCYKYIIESAGGKKTYKADPYGFSSELRPKSDSVLCEPFGYNWTDAAWLDSRSKANHTECPINIYEVQLSSWDSVIEDDKPIDLKKTGASLIAYAKSMHYTHIELMPVTEYPLDGSWGYQTTGYFALSARYGKPQNLQDFINLCHKNNLGVILDWVPGHFCPDEHGLTLFDGTHLYGSQYHPHWGTYKFDFEKKHVRSFLMSSAMFWAKCYHIDGIRADGVTSMLYLNYGTDSKEKKNAYGGEDDLDAKEFIKQFNDLMHENFPGFLTFAEESSAYQGVTAPTYMDGLGFDYKWNMGWMNDTLEYFSQNSLNKLQKHDKITFSTVYMRDEKFILPFSHDEVVHGKKQLLEKMPGDDWHKFASLRVLMAYQLFHPGKKLNFMGNELAQRMEWRYYEPLEWFMLKYPIHDSFHEYIREINRLYKKEAAFYELDNDILGFEWIDGDNRIQSVYSFVRRAKDGSEIIAVLNMSENNYPDFKVGVPNRGKYKEILSSNLAIYDGTGEHTEGVIASADTPIHGRAQSIEFYLPALTALAFKKQ